MPYHLLRCRYSPETWDRMARTPENRMAASRGGAADFGGEMVGYWYAVGARDVYSLMSAPDMVAGAALHATLFSSGAFLDFDQSILLDVDEMKEALRISSTWPSLQSYHRPGDRPDGEG